MTCQILDVCITLVVETAVFDQKSDSPLPKLGFAFAKDYFSLLSYYIIH